MKNRPKNNGYRSQSSLKRNLTALLLLITAFFILYMSGCYEGHGLSPPEGVSAIKGTITYIGTPPDSTKEVWIAVLKRYPHDITDSSMIYLFVISNLVLSDSVPFNQNTVDYELEIKAGVYDWILVVWFPDLEDYLFGAKELGAYYANPDDPFPAPVHVPKNTTVEGINITADFNNIHRTFPFFKKKK